MSILLLFKIFGSCGGASSPSFFLPYLGFLTRTGVNTYSDSRLTARVQLRLTRISMKYVHSNRR